MLRSIFAKWSIPAIDLFATKDNKCDQFCSQLGLSPGTLTNAFHLNWESVLMYAFPMIPLIPQLILKLKLNHTKLILIATIRLRQRWFSDLLSLSIQPPISLPHCPDLLPTDSALWLSFVSNTEQSVSRCVDAAWLDEEEECMMFDKYLSIAENHPLELRIWRNGSGFQIDHWSWAFNES